MTGIKAQKIVELCTIAVMFWVLNRFFEDLVDWPIRSVGISLIVLLGLTLTEK